MRNRIVMGEIGGGVTVRVGRSVFEVSFFFLFFGLVSKRLVVGLESKNKRRF